MSKGYGKRQRELLEALVNSEAVLLPSGLTRVEYNSILRAAMRLEAAGKVGVHRWAFGRPRTAICRPGLPRPVRESVKVGKVTAGNFTNT